MTTTTQFIDTNKLPRVQTPQGEAIAYRGLHYCRRAHLPADSDPDSPAA